MTKKTEIDLSTLSLEQLKDLLPAAQERVTELEQEKRQQALEKMEAAAAEVGMTPAELLKHFGVAGRPKKVAKAKYRNPDNASQTWTGRGRKPEWVKVWLEAGKELEALAISD